ncbi:MAG: tRNA 2-thiocytidine biosynthesis protein TtcA [Clostridiales bacterium]|jgi:tRNA(Ile)-lysidine synthase TilS/MesJ|nr:tRNA 2-thiocytidine biosynthesis protein TtcA [Clostridiales bacterium]MDK2934508.1 tRNA 2-thiocytidine biosynthesis protein TtcA [Clostridiales bacterium]
MQRILSYLRKAVEDYNMIQDGDRIAIGVSGGKDSLTLLTALKALQRFYPKKFELEAITLTMGFDNFDLSGVQKLCDELGINYTIKPTNIAEVIFDIRKETNPCSLCAKMRRGALHDVALELGCKKVALGHHHDDVIETFFLSLFFEGRINCFSPVTYLDRKDIYLIRPMIYVPEKDIRGFSRRKALPVVASPCPANGNTKRQYIKELLADLNRENKGLKTRLFGAIQRSEIEGWKLD